MLALNGHETAALAWEFEALPRRPGKPPAPGRIARTWARTVLGFALALILAVVALPANAQTTTLRIGFQKYGTLILLKARGTLEEALRPLGVSVEWAEFPAGPQLLEALNAGLIDFTATGESPPIFAQAAGTPLVYVGYEPEAPLGEAILVLPDSPIQTVADLRGKTIALNRGSNVHYLLVQALAAAGVPYNEVTTAYLNPADGRAAFESPAVDAWVIWDPFQAAAEAATGARTIANGTDLVANHQFYLAARPFAEANPAIIDAVLEQIGAIDDWARDNTAAVAEELAPQVGIPADILAVALSRQTYGVLPVDAEVIAKQQAIADAFFQLGLITTAINVGDAVVVRAP